VRLFRRKGPPHRDHVGPADRWERIGRDGFDLLLRHGLREEHRVLDIGCGSLRFGRLLIPFLLPERYCGLEPAEDRVREGLAREVEAVYGPELLSRKAPRFDANPSFDLEVFGERFDLLFAFSVFIHCGREQLEACLRSAAKVMAPSSLFLLDLNLAGASSESGRHSKYPWASHQTVRWERDEAMATLEGAGFRVEVVQEEPNPRKRKARTLYALRLPGGEE
jgi:SAM-dependent methyltransferase